MRKKKSLTIRIFIGLILGLIVGLVLNWFVPAGFLKDEIMLNGILKLFGTGFINAIKMMVVPLVFVSLICGVSSMGDIKKLGRVGLKTVLFYLLTTAAAITIALIVSKIINPGYGLDMSNIVSIKPEISEPDSFVTILINMIPTNPIQSLVTGNMLQIIVFAILFGVCINLVGEKANIIRRSFDVLNDIFMKMILIIMNLAPYGVFALIATTFATTGVESLFSLFKYVVTVVLVLAIHAFLIYSLFGKIFTKLSLKPFFKRFSNVAGVTFSTSSSNASIPVSIENMDKLGIDRSISSFTIPLGATINMDGTAIMQGVACVFIAQIYGIEMNISMFLTIILTATLASIGTAGVPGVGMITLSMVLTSVGLPIEGVALIMGVDRIIDMFRTTVNVMGDCICTLIVAKSENKLDLNRYYSTEKEDKEKIEELKNNCDKEKEIEFTKK